MLRAAYIRKIFDPLRRPKHKNPCRRHAVTRSKRDEVWNKTKGHCHLCGGRLHQSDWQCDHVVAHESGGDNSIHNLLPVCCLCNRFRWGYRPKVRRLILRLGVYAKHEIRQRTKLGQELVRLAERRSARDEKRRE
jgi:5-methylcytosine-specific restriction endonuclease McrA